MNIKHLSTFVTVAKTRNMAHTAAALNYSHSTIYSHLMALEKEFGVELYSRTAHGIELTPDGETFFSYAEKFLYLYHEAHAAFSAHTQSAIRIGGSESSDVCLMHDLLREFVSKNSSVEIEYTKMTTDVSMLKLIAGACDIVFACEHNLDPGSLYCQYLCTLKLVFVTGVQPSDNKATQRPKLLGTMKPSVAQEMMHSVGLRFSDYFSSLTNIGDLISIRQLLSYGPGVAILPKSFVEEDLAKGILFRVPTMPQELELDIFILTPSQSHIGPYTQALIDLAFSFYNPQRLPRYVFPPENT